MTTAHRPTFDPARGGGGRNESDLSKLSKQYSARDMPGHTKIKYRQTGQATTEELRDRDLADRRRELADRERAAARESSSRRSRRGEVSEAKRPRLGAPATASTAPVSLDADEPLDPEEEDEDDEDDEDDTAELMAELSRIKAERAAEKAEKDAAREAEEERIRTENILHGNPLLNQDKSDFKVARRWDDDVVFKNCAKGQSERAKDPSFINDAIRGEFHKKFMERYVK